MPHDKNGKLLNIGDRVAIPAVVKQIGPSDEYCNVTVETEEPMAPSPTKTTITLNTRQVISAMAAMLVALMALVFSACPAKAQTNGDNVVQGGATATLWDFVTTGSNYWVAPYSTVSTGDHSFGGGVALGYQLSELVNPVLRLDYFGGSVYMPSLTAQLQPPRQLFGKIPVIPFGIAGIGTPIAGAATDNGKLITILGAGAALKLDAFGSSAFLKHTDLVADYEHWAGLPAKQQNQIRIGVLFKF